MSVNRVSSLLCALLFAAVAITAPSAALAQTRAFSFAYDQPKSSGYGVGAEMFNNKLMELSKGTLSINQYPGAQLGTEAQTLQKVQTGDIDFVMLSTANASTAQPESGVFSIHFIFRDEAHAIKVLGDAKVIAAMKELYAAKMKGAHMLGLGSQGLRHMYGKKAIEKVADLKGVKMRVQATVTEDETFPAYGAQVVHMPFGEVYTSLQTALPTWPRMASTTTSSTNITNRRRCCRSPSTKPTTPRCSSATRCGAASPTNRRNGCKPRPMRSTASSRRRRSSSSINRRTS